MPDDTVESAPSADTVDSTVPADAASSAETENTDTAAAPQEHMIPKSRMDEANSRAYAAEQKSVRLEAALQEAAKPEATPTPAPAADEPPGNLNERERARWYIQRDAAALFEEKLGMPMEEAATLLKTVPATAQNDAKRQWTDQCSQHGLNPEDENVQAMVWGLTQGGKVGLSDAFGKVEKLGIGKVAAPAVPAAIVPGASVENDTGLTGVRTGSNVQANTPREAAELAAKGIAVKHKSSQEIIEEAIARGRAASGS